MAAHYRPHTLRVPAINLIPKDPFYDTLVGKTMVWAIHIGRYIIVFTEIIVIMSFASRFKLDRDLTDLNARIVQKKAVVESFAQVEDKIRLIQKKTNEVKKLNDSAIAMKQLATLITKIPDTVQLTQLNYIPEALSFAGTAANASSFAQLVSALQQEPSFLGVSVERISSGEGNEVGITFAMQVKLLEEKPIAPTPQQPPAEAAGAGAEI